MNTYIHLWQYLAELFLEWEVFRERVAEKINTRYMFYNLFPKIVPFMR
jgi:hypothetical protein